MRQNLIKTMEMQFLKMKIVVENLIKRYKNNETWLIWQTFQNVKNPYKTNGKRGLSKCVKNLIKPMETQFVKMQKRGAKSLIKTM